MACVYMKCEVEKINIGAMIRAKNEVAFVKVHESWSLVEGDRTLVGDVYWEGSSLVWISKLFTTWEFPPHFPSREYPSMKTLAEWYYFNHLIPQEHCIVTAVKILWKHFIPKCVCSDISKVVGFWG